jgi:hypothetical protein
MLRRYFGFARKQKMAERLTNPALLKVQADFTRLVEFELEPAEKDWNRVTENRHDFRADQEREALRPRLAALYRTEKELTRQMAVEEERERIANELFPHFTREDSTGVAMLSALLNRPEAPDRVPVTELWLCGRRREEIRRQLYDVTADPRFSKARDFVDELRYYWHVQQEAREKVLRIVLSPGHRPKAEAPPWAAQVARLRELSTVKEEQNAVVR